MEKLTCRALIERFPATLRDRRGLAFTGYTPFPEVVAGLDRDGVVMLRGALSAKELRLCHRSFRHFAATLNNESASGSWHDPWAVRFRDDAPAAAVIAMLLRSWAWKVVETICGSTDVVLLLASCIARH